MPDVDSETKDALWNAWFNLSTTHALPLIKVVVDTNQNQRVKIAHTNQNQRGRRNSSMEDEAAYGLYQASHLSVQEFCFASHLAETIEQIDRYPTAAVYTHREMLISLLETYENSFFHNAFSLLGEFNDGEMPTMIQSFKSFDCSSDFLSNLLAIHSQYPSLKELDLAGNQNITDLNWCNDKEAVEGLELCERLNMKNCTNVTHTRSKRSSTHMAMVRMEIYVL